MTTKTSPSADIQSALDKCESIEASLVKEAKFLADSAAEFNALQRTIDVSDLGQVGRATALLTIAAVGSPRRTYRHQEFETARKALLDSSQRFVKAALVPRLRDLETRARARVEAKLKAHFPEAGALNSAVNHSTEMSVLGPIQVQAIIRDYGIDGAIRTAKVLLEAWAAADAFEAEYLS